MKWLAAVVERGATQRCVARVDQRQQRQGAHLLLVEQLRRGLSQLLGRVQRANLNVAAAQNLHAQERGKREGAGAAKQQVVEERLSEKTLVK